MMPKFRAWIKESNQIKDISLIHFDYQLIKTKGGKWYRVEDVILMQSTRLLDWNGTEIFEGDIVKVSDEDNRTDFIDGGVGAVGGISDLFMWYIDGEVNNGLFETRHQYYIEVIGNVHENPELLDDV